MLNWWVLISPQLPHSYYFTTCILVLKLVNKGIFFEEIQDSHFHRKGGSFGTHLHECGEKRVIFYVQCFTVKRGGSFGLKSQCFTTKKVVHFGLKSQCFIVKMGRFELKSQCFAAKKGVIFKLENKDRYHFSQWVREPGISLDWYDLLRDMGGPDHVSRMAMFHYNW